MQNIIETQSISKHYNTNPEPAVNAVSFAVRPGEIFSLLGPNGAGKTTLISMLSCLLKPSAGDALVAGASVIGDPQRVKAMIGVIPQQIALYPSLSARENMLFWGGLYGLRGGDLHQRVDELLEIVGLSDRARQRVETFSGGMQRRINIAVGLLHKPSLVFMDEPTVGIDPQSRRSILETVKALNAEGMTVLYTTHYMEEAQELSDRIAIIDHGKLIALGTLGELTKLVGEKDSLEMRVSEGSMELVAAFGALQGVEDVQAANGRVTLVADDGNAVLPDLVHAANQLGVRLLEVVVKEPNLEAVFLHLTGRALRD